MVKVYGQNHIECASFELFDPRLLNIEVKYRLNDSFCTSIFKSRIEEISTLIKLFLNLQELN